MKKRQLRITSHRFGFGVLVSVLLLLVASVTSCSKDNKDRNRLPDGEYPMVFTAKMAEQTNTRATSNNSWVGGEEVAVQWENIVKKYTVTDYNELSVADGLLPFYWLSTENITVTAWYSHVYSDIRPTSFTVQTDQSSDGYQQSDMLYASQEVTFAYKSITFKHLPTKIVVNLQNGDGVTEDELINATVSIENQTITGVIADDWSVPQETPGNISIIPNSIPAISDAKRSVQALLVPQQMQNKKFIKVNIWGNDYFYTPINDTDANLESGKQYTYTIIVKKNGITVTASGATTWTKNEVNVSSKYPLPGFTANELKIGDYYYSDGSWSDGGYRKYEGNLIELLPIEPILTDANGNERTVIGIVYWVGNATQYDKTLKKDYPNCTKGLAVSLREDENIAWQISPTSIQNWLNENHGGVFMSVHTGREAKDPMNNIQGYNNTKALLSYNDTNKDHIVSAAQKVVDYRNSVAAPSTSSNWYLPSTKELSILRGKNIDNIWYNDFGTDNRDVINKKLSSIGGTPLSSVYWSSSENTYNIAFFVDFDNKGLLFYSDKNKNNKLRFSIAF